MQVCLLQAPADQTAALTHRETAPAPRETLQRVFSRRKQSTYREEGVS